ncbi:MAG TPA: hypothetical protein VJS64_08515 [Pyrinomonadaceae bacterium]|nr:hypothetical protein [Pyrinomonadaceae bacterium]
MNKFRLILFVCTTALLLSAFALPSTANKRVPTRSKFVPLAQQVGPLDLAGELHGAPYRIRVPATWNGTLLVWAHGYRDKADHPGEVDNRNADIAPSAALEAPLLAQGYALAGSAYRDNGWEVEGAIQDMKDLTVLFRAYVGQPDRTILWGASLGSIITFESMERFGGVYNGALAMCGAGAGSTRNWDLALALYLGYDVVFGALPAWGSAAEVRNDLDFDSEVLPKLVPELSNIANFPKFEFLRLVTGTPGRGLTPPPPPAFYPGWVLTDMFFATEARAELQRRAGGPFVQNLNHVYNLTAAERAYLNGLGVPSPVIDGWLAAMSARTNIAAPPAPRNYVEHYATYTGKIKSPVLTMHTIIDPLVVVSNESAYLETVLAAGRTDRLFQTYTTGIGHCSFTGPQLLTAVGAIDNWVRNGVKPTAATFPAALGFNSAFVPPAFPQP